MGICCAWATGHAGSCADEQEVARVREELRRLQARGPARRRRVVSISLKAARELLAWCGDQLGNPAIQPYLDELRDGLGYNPEKPITHVARKFFGP